MKIVILIISLCVSLLTLSFIFIKKSNCQKKWDYYCFRDKTLTFYELDEKEKTKNNELLKVIANNSELIRDSSMTFYNSEYTNDSLLVLNKFGYFDFNKERYYYFFYSNLYYDCFECVNFLSLCKVKGNDIINIPIGYQSSNEPFCFGDFNKDSVLDYLNWDYTDTVRYYSLTSEESFKLNKLYYIVLKIPEPGIYYIDKKASKFWY